MDTMLAGAELDANTVDLKVPSLEKTMDGEWIESMEESKERNSGDSMVFVWAVSMVLRWMILWMAC